MAKGDTKAYRNQAYLFKRYLWLISVLMDYKRLSYREISEMWARSSLNDQPEAGLPRRTFYDHIDAIQEVFGVSIKNEGRGRYQYYVKNEEEIHSDVLRSWMLDNFSLGNVLLGAKGIQNRIFLQDIPSSKRWLSIIIDAIKEKRVLQMEYTSFKLGKVPTLFLCPLFVKLYENRWYVYAHRTDNKVMKQYALDRIDHIVVTDERFEDEPSDEELACMAHCFGHLIYPGIKPRNIYLKATSQAACFLDTLPLQASQVKVREDADGAVFRYYSAPTSEFESKIKSWNGQLEVLSEEESEIL